MKSVFQAVRIVAAFVALTLFVPIAIVIAHAMVPVHSASMRVEAVQTIVTLRFYYIWGRYLQVSTPADSITFEIEGCDWCHSARHSIYLTPRREIAVLGPTGAGDLIRLDRLWVGTTWVGLTIGPISARSTIDRRQPMAVSFISSVRPSRGSALRC